MYLYSFPNFPNSAEPDGLRSFGKLGNWEICTCSHFPISEIVLGHMGWGLLGNWEMDWARFVYKQRACLQTQPWGTNLFSNVKPISVYKRRVCL